MVKTRAKVNSVVSKSSSPDDEPCGENGSHHQEAGDIHSKELTSFTIDDLVDRIVSRIQPGHTDRQVGEVNQGASTSTQLPHEQSKPQAGEVDSDAHTHEQSKPQAGEVDSGEVDAPTRKPKKRSLKATRKRASGARRSATKFMKQSKAKAKRKNTKSKKRKRTKYFSSDSDSESDSSSSSDSSSGTFSSSSESDSDEEYGGFNSSQIKLDQRVPSKIKEKIWQGEYIDFELLLNAAKRPGFLYENKETRKKCRQEMKSILDWITGFNVFMAIYIAQHPSEAANLLHYLHTVMELSRLGGDWLSYDRDFRMCKASGGNFQWQQLNTELSLHYRYKSHVRPQDQPCRGRGGQG